jgi:hypothetical protein
MRGLRSGWGMQIMAFSAYSMCPSTLCLLQRTRLIFTNACPHSHLHLQSGTIFSSRVRHVQQLISFGHGVHHQPHHQLLLLLKAWAPCLPNITVKLNYLNLIFLRKKDISFMEPEFFSLLLLVTLNSIDVLVE